MRQRRRVHLQRVQDSLRNSGISMEYTATATPQQNGVPERVERTLAATVRCLLKDGNFPPNMRGELFFTAVYLTSRSPHATLGGRTPFFKMHDKEADLSALGAIGSRAFVHIEHPHTKARRQGLGRQALRVQSGKQSVSHLQPCERNCGRNSQRHFFGDTSILDVTCGN